MSQAWLSWFCNHCISSHAVMEEFFLEGGIVWSGYDRRARHLPESVYTTKASCRMGALGWDETQRRGMKRGQNGRWKWRKRCSCYALVGSLAMASRTGGMIFRAVVMVGGRGRGGRDIASNAWGPLDGRPDIDQNIDQLSISNFGLALGARRDYDKTKKAFLSRFAAITREEVVPDTPESLVRLFKDLSLPLGGKEPSPSPIRQPYRTGGLASSSVPPSSPCPSTGYKVASGWSTLGDVEEEEEEEEDEEHQEEEEDEEQQEEEEDEEQQEEEEDEEQQEEEEDEEQDEQEQEQEEDEEQDEQEQEQVELEADSLCRRVDESREGLNETHPTPSRPPTLPDKPDQEMDRIAKARMARRNKLLELAGKKVPAPLPSPKSRASATAPTGSRKAANPRDESSRPAPPANGKPRDKSRSKTGKVVAVPTTRPPQNARANDDDDTDEEGAEGESKNKGGRLSRSAIAQAQAIRQKYQDDLQALADKEGKTFAAILSAVGDTVSDTRSLNPWNAFQAYATHPDGLGMTKAQDESTAHFKKRIREAYRDKCEGVDDVEGEFAEILEWYSTAIASQTAQKRLEGLSEKQLVKIAGPFNNRGRQVWETYQVSCFGWIVDGISARAVAFGSDPYYLGMKEDNPSQMRDQCIDYGTMIHTQLMRKKQGVSLDPQKQKIINKYMGDKSNKATLRALVKDIWVHDLQTLCPNSKITRMKWGPAFADMCYREKVKLVNYPRGLKAIGAPGGLAAVSGIQKNALKVIEARAMSREGLGDSEEEGRASLWADGDDDDDGRKPTELFEEDLCRFVPWDEDEKALSYQDRANVGIVTQVSLDGKDPLVLTKVLHSKSYVAATEVRRLKVVGGDDTEEDAPEREADSAVLEEDADESDVPVAPPPTRKRRVRVPTAAPPAKSRVAEEDADESDVPVAPPRTKKRRAPTAAPPAKSRAAEEDSEEEESVTTVPTKKKRRVAIAAPPAKSRVAEEDADESNAPVAPPPMKKRRIPTAAPPAKSRATEEDSEEEESVTPVPTKKRRVAVAAPPAKPRVAEEDSEESVAPVPTKKRRVPIAGPPEEESVVPVPTKKRRVHTAPPPAEEQRDVSKDLESRQPKKRARLDRKVGKMSGSGMKVPNDQGGLTGALGKKRKRDEDVPGAVTQAPRPIANLPKRRNNT
ncbi:hypothetical protein BT96DRAFT_945583 [Gymnopus androsaceus JB14]|uniref:Uncharacterized protein n=1 Tax=Gymnopus androsaceus JB14 TaxID=1447944 RepID=A0A6A4H1H0_9AGAR|nr:hypothetical protein BT96DRAFT_945583 [Gymnopus androsaceus JB14]